jgi:hypothetical protein
MKIKKILGLSLSLAIAASVVGCSEDTHTDGLSNTLINDKLTHVEWGIYQKYHAQKFGSANDYTVLFSAVNGRTSKHPEDAVAYCDVAKFLSLNDDTRVGKKMDAILLEAYGETIWNTCMYNTRRLKEGDVKPMDLEVLNQEVLVEAPMDSDTLSELTAAASTCNIAKVLIITTERIDDISNGTARGIIDNCKWSKLKEELNK